MERNVEFDKKEITCDGHCWGACSYRREKKNMIETVEHISSTGTDTKQMLIPEE